MAPRQRRRTGRPAAVPLRHAVHRVVLRLAGRGPVDACLIAQAHQLREPPGPEVGHADVADLALALEIGESTHRLIERRARIMWAWPSFRMNSSRITWPPDAWCGSWRIGARPFRGFISSTPAAGRRHGPWRSSSTRFATERESPEGVERSSLEKIGAEGQLRGGRSSKPRWQDHTRSLQEIK